MTVREAVLSRRSMRSFDPTATITSGEVALLLHEATPAPSALNLQNWEFVVCIEQEDKDRLRAVAFDQKKISDASAVIIILGRGDLQERVKSHPLCNCFPSEEAEEWERLAMSAYESDPQRCRDEAFRSCSLFAMTFMLLALEAGWSTAPIGGFDASALAREFDVPDHYIPVLLVAVGQPGARPFVSPRPKRVPLEELMHVGRFGSGRPKGSG
jgi:nitroreductase